jgi:hypothetical protein
VISELKTGDLVKLRSEYIFLPFVFHYGIISLEDGKIYIYHSITDKENKYGGNLVREDFEEVIKGREILAVESLNIKKENFYNTLDKLQKRKYDVFTNNCEHFVNFIKEKRFVSNQLKTWGLAVSLGIVVYLFIKKK